MNAIGSKISNHVTKIIPIFLYIDIDKYFQAMNKGLVNYKVQIQQQKNKEFDKVKVDK